MTLIEKVQSAISKEQFDFLQMTGFRENTNLAMLAGAVIGYKVGIDEAKKCVDEFERHIAEFKNILYDMGMKCP